MRSFVVGLLLLAGCAEASRQESDVTSEARGPQICPAIAILCVEGYHAKSVGNCHQICVPDHGAECTADADCSIYCITQPCPVGRCVGNSCRVFENPPGPPTGTTCKPTCAPGYYCSECKTVDGSGFFCLPDDAAC